MGTIDVESEHLNAFDSAAQALLEECARVLTDSGTAAGCIANRRQVVFQVLTARCVDYVDTRIVGID